MDSYLQFRSFLPKLRNINCETLFEIVPNRAMYFCAMQLVDGRFDRATAQTYAMSMHMDDKKSILQFARKKEIKLNKII